MRGIIVCLLMLGVAANVHAQEQQFSREVGVPLEAAQAEIKKQRWDAALKKLQEADAVKKKTPFEQYHIDELKAFIYARKGQYGQVAELYERMLASGQTPPARVPQKIKTLTQIYASQRNHAKTIEYGNRWIKQEPNSVQPYELVAQAYFMQSRQQAAKGVASASKGFNLAAQTIQRAIAINEKAGRKPEENWLNIQLNSYHALNNSKAILATREKLVRYYPTRENWRHLLTLYSRQIEDDRAKLNLYRLMLDVGVLDDPNDYVEMAQMMMDEEFGIPGEAVRVIQQGFENKVLDRQNERHLRLLRAATELADKTRVKLDEQAPLPDITRGKLYLSYGENDKAIEAIRHGISKGSLEDPDDARMLLGLALHRSGQKEEARKAFLAVSNNSALATIADLWALRTQQS